MSRLVAGTGILNPVQVNPDLTSPSPKVTSALVGGTSLTPSLVVHQNYKESYSSSNPHGSGWLTWW